MDANMMLQIRICLIRLKFGIQKWRKFGVVSKHFLSRFVSNKLL